MKGKKQCVLNTSLVRQGGKFAHFTIKINIYCINPEKKIIFVLNQEVNTNRFRMLITKQSPSKGETNVSQAICQGRMTLRV